MKSKEEVTWVGCGLAALIFLVLVVGGSFLGALALKLLWNWVAVAVFHAPVITYWQAFGLSLLISFVAGAFRGVVTVNSREDK